MKNFAYVRPKSIDEASTLLNTHAESAVPFGGGTDVLGLLKDKVIAPETVVNLKTVSGMKSIEYSGRNGLRIGALTTVAEIANNPDIAENYPILSQAAIEIASPQLRNAGTIGGNLCQRPRCWYFRGDFHCLKKGGDLCYAFDGENRRHCIIGGGPCFIVHPSDLAVALLALDARVTIFSGGNTRTISLNELYHLPAEDPTTEITLKPGEIVTEIQVPNLPENSRSTYIKIKERKVWDFAVVSVGAVLRKNGTRIQSGRVAFGGVAPIPWQEDALNEQLSGLAVNDQNLEKVVQSAFTDASPLERNGYKVPLVRNVTRQALKDLMV